ncbi:hypothetical protein ABIE18_004341 [Arthrobacter sp. 2762]
MEIPNLVTDSIGNEVTRDPVSGVDLALHNALMINLGIEFTEIIALDNLPTIAPLTGNGLTSTPRLL